MLALLPVLAALASAPADLQAVGVVVASESGHSAAILRSGGRTRVVGLGETAFGGRVSAIAPGRVCLEFGDEKVDLRLIAPPPTPAASAPPVPAPPGAAPPPYEVATVQTMERREVDRRLGQEIPRILAETTVVPVTEEGRVTGLALTRIPEGSLLTEAGLRPGDVLTRINDTEIDGLGTLIGLWPRLQNATELRAVVLRGGRPVSLAVSLR